MKRFLMMLFVACVFMATLFSVDVFAAEQEIVCGFLPRTYEQNSGPAYEILESYTDMTAFRSFLDTELKACNTEINVSSFNISLDAVNALGQYVYKDIPEAFHVEGMGYSYYSSSSTVAYLRITYNMTKTEYDKTMELCREVASEMLDGLDAPGLSQAEKALILHDRLAVHCEYDCSISKDNIYDMVGPLLNRFAVCEGYAKTYSYLLDQVGIRNYYISSDLLRHGWNIVYIDGEKYHVDVTWDDPTEDATGLVRHVNFLRSTDGIISTGHHVNGRYDFDGSPVNTQYDEAFWQNSDTAFQLIDGDLYYIDNGSFNDGVYLMQVKSGADEKVLNVSDDWNTSEGYWGDGFQRLSSDGKDLLFSTSDGVYCYSIDC